jgi:purine nucleosidase/pyrimidine-specific ribonucleoside hydrolase
MKNVLIDCDPGIDDSVALLFALNHPALNVRAITIVSGNLTADLCSENARKILHLSALASARNIPVSRGPLKPLVRPYPRDPFSHGPDGLGGVGITDLGGIEEKDQFAPDTIIECVNQYQDVTTEEGRKGLTILCLGPMTNLALALIKDPSLPSKVAEVLFIGGSFGFGSAGSVRATGDNPVSEWNVYVDPEAADLVFKGGFNLTALGLDVVTHPTVELSHSHREALRTAALADNPAAKFLTDIVVFAEIRNFASWCCLIDSVAVAAAVDKSIVEVEEVSVVVETHSPLALGQTIVDRRERADFKWQHLAKIKAAKTIHADRFLDLLVKTLVEGAKSK